MMSVTDKRVYACDHCPYHTDRRNNLKRHTVTMHETSEALLECCGAQFENKSALRQHTSTCHRQGYVCAICGRVFCRRALLRRHHAVHTGIKEFSCTVCSYATSHKSNLDRHMKIHSEFAYDSSTSPYHASQSSPNTSREDASTPPPFSSNLSRPMYTFPFPTHSTPCFLGETASTYPPSSYERAAPAALPSRPRSTLDSSRYSSCFEKMLGNPPTDPLYVAIHSPGSRQTSITPQTGPLDGRPPPKLRHAIDVILGHLSDGDSAVGTSMTTSSTSPFSCSSSQSSLPELLSMSPPHGETMVSPNSTHNKSHLSGGIVTCAATIKPKVDAANAMLLENPMVENFASSKFSITDNCKPELGYIHKKWRMAKRFQLS